MTLRQINPDAHRALVFTPMEQRRQLLVEAAVLADQLGYHTVMIPEGWGFDAGIVLAEIAIKTTDIRVAIGVASIWGRSPATLAMMAATLDDLSGGRFTLGLGSSTPALAERFHGVAFHRPAVRLGHTIEQVRTLLAGGRAAGTGGRGLRLGIPVRADLPIWAAALGPRATSIAVHAADGWLTALAPLDCLDRMRTGAATANDGDPILIAGPIVAVGPAARRAAEQLVGWYLTGMGPVYGDFVSSLGFDGAVATLRAANPRPVPEAINWPRAADPLLDQLAVIGDQLTITSRLATWDERADIVTIGVGPGAPDDVLAAVTAAAPPMQSAAHSGPRCTSLQGAP